MIELRHIRPWSHDPKDDTWRRAEWQRTYLCLGGVRLGVINLAKPGLGLRVLWRWSCRGIEADTGRYRWYFVWMHPQFRKDN